MNEKGALPELGKLMEQRLALVRRLAESLELSSSALAHNDAEGIARGAAHQAELCLQWGRLEDQLRRRPPLQRPWPGVSINSTVDENTARLQAEWETLGSRIRYLTRVHWSLLRHLERSLAVVNRVVNSCAATYALDPHIHQSGLHLEARE